MGILGFCFIVIIALLIGQHFANREAPLEGTLVGDFVASTTLQPVKVPAGDSGLSKAQVEPIVAALKQSPLRAGSQLIHTELRGVTGGLEVHMIPTPTSRVVRVNPTNNEVLANWISENSERLLAKRNSDLAAAASQFFEDYNTFIGGGPKVTLTAYYRNQLGLAAMCSGFGYVVEGIATGRRSRQAQCPCVAEDSAGNLYFAVPAGTETITLRGRTMSDGRKLFDGTFTVRCAIAAEQIQTIEPTPPPTKSTAEPAKSKTDKSTSPDPAAGESPTDGATDEMMKGENTDSSMMKMDS